MSIEIPKTEEQSEIRHKEIAELEAPIFKIFKEILPTLEKGEYDLIIGIDASGRIPTLIIDKLVNYVYTKNSQEFPKTRFLAGSGSKEDAEEYIKTWDPRKKVLIVEDTILTGTSVKFLTEVLNKKTYVLI